MIVQQLQHDMMQLYSLRSDSWHQFPNWIAFRLRFRVFSEIRRWDKGHSSHLDYGDIQHDILGYNMEYKGIYVDL